MTRFRVDDQLCFALYDASHAVVGSYRAGLAELGLTYTQYLVLLSLWQRNPRTVGEIGADLHLDSGTLSPLLKRLEAQGLVARRRSAQDERLVDVGLTDRGNDLRLPARRVQQQVERATGLAADELAELRSTLQRVAQSVRRSGSAQVG